MKHKMKKLTQMYTYICERCGEINHARFFDQHKVGYRWGEKCENCSMNLQDGVCAYTWHRIIFTNPKKKQPAINWRGLKGKYLKKNSENSGNSLIQKPAKKEQKATKNLQENYADNLPF